MGIKDQGGQALDPENDARSNRGYWDGYSDEYQRLHGSQLLSRPLAWGTWSISEGQLRVLGDVSGKDILEVGCGAAQWSISLVKLGARPVGLDNSGRQLRHARELLSRVRVRFPLVQGSAERVPFRGGCFDIVFSDHGGFSFGDPARTIPEAARLLRPGGLLAFNMATPLHALCWSDGSEKVESRLQRPYFGMRRFQYADGLVEYQLQYGEWIRLFRRNGLRVEDLVELQAPADGTTTYLDYVPKEWARRWPAEHIWKTRKEG